MSLPLKPPIEPMLAKSSPTIPEGMAYEPKWDGFRCLVFADGDQVQLISRNGRELTRYFPEVLDAVRAEAPERCVLDGEVVLVAGDRLDFTMLTERIHPAASRIARLASQWPASLVCWDLLALGSQVLTEVPFAERRARLEAALRGSGSRVHLTPLTLDRARAERWFDQFEGAGLDGVVAKPLDQPYQPGKRAMVKVKHSREADVVVAGYRLHRASTPERPLLGSLQLGLFDQGKLFFVGVAAAFTEPVRAELAQRLGTGVIDSQDCSHPWAAADSAGPRGTSRWNAELKSTLLIDPLLVCTVGYEHLEGRRFRHTAQFRRWRPDRTPESCDYAQLDETPRFDLAKVLSGEY